ncbi:MAG: head-tail adaptor protein [Rubrivivax sp.]|nr:MAG: head-tail adaptor protein [Rubrivivax sp.]
MALNNRITVRRQQAGQDTAGQPVIDWIEVAKVWADVAFESGTSAIQGDKPTSTVRASVRVRRRADFAAGMQIEWSGSVLRISAILPDAKSRAHMNMVCEGSK